MAFTGMPGSASSRPATLGAAGLPAILAAPPPPPPPVLLVDTGPAMIGALRQPIQGRPRP